MITVAAPSAPVSVPPAPPVAPAPAVPAAPELPTFTTPEGFTLPKLSLPGPTDPGNRHPDAPPSAGSLLQKAELKVMHVVQDHRTEEGNAWAQHFDAKLGLPIWLHELGTIRQNHGVFDAVKGAALLGTTLAANVVATELLKRKFDRPRPYEADPTITTVVPKPHDASFPSGHTSSAFAAARVLAHYEPERTADLYKLAGEAAAARVYAGVHYPSDVVAGAALGTAVAQGILSKLPGN